MLFAKRSVASITAKLERTVTELEAHAESEIANAKDKAFRAEELLREKVAHLGEHDLAKKVAANIRSLLS